MKGLERREPDQTTEHVGLTVRGKSPGVTQYRCTLQKRKEPTHEATKTRVFFACGGPKSRLLIVKCFLLLRDSKRLSVKRNEEASCTREANSEGYSL